MSEFERMDLAELESLSSLEALLFIAAEPVAPGHLATILEKTTEEVNGLLKQLETEYHDRGIRLQWHAGKVQLTSAPEKAELIEKFLGLESTSRLSRAALETLAIIAYRQPVTHPSLDAIRGVNSDGVMKSLLNKGLIQEIGRSETPGRPILYGTTADFLQYFGLSSLGELPPMNEMDHSSEIEVLKE